MALTPEEQARYDELSKKFASKQEEQIVQAGLTEDEQKRYEELRKKFEPKEPAPEPQPVKEEGGIGEFFKIREDAGEVLASAKSFVTDEEREKIDRKALQTPVISGEVPEMRILPSEIEGIARKHGIPASKLRSFDWSAFFGAPEATGTILGEAAQASEGLLGSLSEMVLLGIPQKLAVSLQSDDKYKAALEDLRTVALAKKSGLVQAAELAGGLKAGLQIAKGAGQLATKLGAGETAAKAVTVVAGVGEAVGGTVAAAESGFEEQAAKVGLALGGALTAGAEVYSFVRNKQALKGMQKAEEELLQEADTVSKVREEAAKHAKSADVVDQVVDVAITRKDMKEVKALADELNTAQGVKKLFGEGAEAEKKLDEAVDEILSNKGEEVKRKMLAEFKDANMLVPDPAKPGNVKLAEIAKINIIQRHLDEQLPKIAQDLGARTGGTRGGIEAIFTRKGEGAKFIKEQYRNTIQFDAFNKLLTDGVIKKLPKSSDNTVLRAMHQLMADAQFVFRSIDRKAGLRTESTLNTMNFQYNAFTRMLARVTSGYEVTNEAGKVIRKVKGLTELNNAREAANIDNNKLYALLDNPKAAGFDALAPAEKQVVKDYQDWFSFTRKEANKQGLNIQDFTQKNGGYVPHMTIDSNDIALRMRDAAKAIKDKYKINLLDYNQEQYKAAAELGLRDDAIYRGLKDALEYLEGGKIRKADDLTTMLARQMNPRTSGAKSISTASATYRRSVEQVPEMIRETDVNKLAARWSSGTFKHAFLRQGFAEIEKARDMLIQRGMMQDAEYLTNWLTDTLGGTRTRTWRALTQEFSNTLLDIRDKHGADSQLGRMAENLLYLGNNTVPKFLSAVYPNFLGFNLRSALQNLSQPLLMTAPELGVSGTAYAARAIAEIAKDPKRAMQRGSDFRAAQWNTELVAVLESSMKRNAIEKGFDRVSEDYTKFAMGMYEAAERANRIITVQMGKLLVKDILAGDATARKYLSKLNVGMRNEIMEAMKANNPELVEKLIINNLIDKTIFQYNRLSMSNFGRVAGPVLSVFSKWPTAIVGDILDVYARRGVARGSVDLMGKYIAPFAMLAIANKAMLGGKAFEQEDPQIQAIVGGKKGLTTLSPLQSLTQGIGVPPAAVATGKFAVGLMGGDLDKAASAVASMGDAYIPMIPSLLRTWNDISRITTADETEYKSLEAIYQENAPEWPEL